MGQPNTWIMLCKGVNLRDTVGDYDTMYFATPEARLAFMLDKAIVVNPSGLTAQDQRRFSAQMYTRVSDNTVRVNANMNTIALADYMVFQNYDLNNEKITYYCFVDNVRYINENVSEIDFHEDSFQTWIDNVTLQNSIIEREIVSSDERFSVDNMTPDFFNGASLKTMYKLDLTTDECQGSYIVLALSDAIYVGDEIVYGQGAYYYDLVDTYPPTVSGGMIDRNTYYITKVDAAHTEALKAFNSICTYIKNNMGGGVNRKDTSQSYIGVYISPEICLPDGVVDYINDVSLGSNDGSDTPVLLLPGNSSYYVAPSVSGYFPKRMVMYREVPYNYKSNNISTTKVKDVDILLSSYITHLFGDGNNEVAIGYLPKNQKLYNAPYCALRVKNNMGRSIEIPIQNMPNAGNVEGKYRFTIRGVPSLVPMVYLDMPFETESENTDYRLTLENYPVAPVKDTQYDNWRNQMLLSIPFIAAQGIITTVTGVASGATAQFDVYQAPNSVKTVGQYKKFVNMIKEQRRAEGVMSLTESGAHTMADVAGGIASDEVSQINNSLVSPQVAHNSSTASANGDIIAQASQTYKFTLELCSIGRADAQIIDDYFTRYGYHIEKFKTPYYGLNSRPTFGYLKTINIGVTGNVPLYAKRKIADIYNRGVRMWTPAHFLDYSQNNDIPVG